MTENKGRTYNKHTLLLQKVERIRHFGILVTFRNGSLCPLLNLPLKTP